MDLNNIAAIGHNHFYRQAKPISFYQNDYLPHYDCIIASTHQIINEIKETRCHESGSYHTMLLQVEKRCADLAEFYNLGGTVILILDTQPLWEFYNSIAGHQHINLIDTLCLQELPLQYSPQNGTGTWAAPQLEGLLSQAQVSFTTVLQNHSTKALIATQRTKSPLSYHQPVDNGLFIALPCITLNDGANEEAFMQGLLDVCEELKREIVVEKVEAAE